MSSLQERTHSRLDAIHPPEHRGHLNMHMNNIIFQLGAYVLKSKSALEYVLTLT